MGDGHIEAILTELAALREEIRGVQMGEDALLTEEEAARLLGIHPKTLYKLRSTGQIRAGYINSSPRYSLGQIRRFAREVMGG
ncbi:MAG TPA: helix-turn-helix domain-containing protein [Rhodothermales bacterium]